jgi:uncharacterized membrane protein YgcG
MAYGRFPTPTSFVSGPEWRKAGVSEASLVRIVAGWLGSAPVGRSALPVRDALRSGQPLLRSCFFFDGCVSFAKFLVSIPFFFAESQVCGGAMKKHLLFAAMLSLSACAAAEGNGNSPGASGGHTGSGGSTGSGGTVGSGGS